MSSPLVCNSNRNNSILALAVKSNFPIIANDGKIWNFSTDVKVYTKKDLILFQVPYQFDSTFEEKSLLSETRFEFYCFKIHSDYGFTTNENRPETNGTFKVDSFFKRIGFLQLERYIIPINKGQFQKINTEEGINGIFMETYKTKEKTGYTDPDTIKFSFDPKLKNYPFSLITELDSVKNSKLYWIRFIFNPTSDPKFTGVIDQREMSFKMEPYPIPNPARIRQYFEYFESKYRSSPLSNK
jgi:hypothetical protein